LFRASCFGFQIYIVVPVILPPFRGLPEASRSAGGALTVSGDSVDTSIFGEYVIQYDVTDSDGYDAAPATREVIVTHPETIPAAPAPADPDMFTHIATLSDLAGSEIPAYDWYSRQAYVTSGDGLQVIDLSDLENPVVAGLIDPAETPFNLNSSEVTSVDACLGMIAFTVPNDTRTENGIVIFTDRFCQYKKGFCHQHPAAWFKRPQKCRFRVLIGN